VSSPGTTGLVKQNRFSKCLDQGLAVLRCFTPERPVLGIADIAAELDMGRSNVHRYAITLVALGYLEQGASRKYQLGGRGVDVGMAMLRATGLRAASREHLELLRASTGYSVGIGLLDRTEALYADRLASHRRGQALGGPRIGAGVRVPVYCTSIGKALLASASAEVRESVLREGHRRRRTSYTITKKAHLRVQLDAIAERGFAVVDQEFHLGLRSLAVPVRDATEVVAAVNLSVYQADVEVDELIESFYPLVGATAEKVSLALGYAAGESRVAADVATDLADRGEP
jgi:IclR family pca regulon transcriptional regulator